MSYGIRILGDALGQHVRLSGHWVSAFDPDAGRGRGHVDGTVHPSAALHFPSPEAAWECWRMQSTAQPLRLDGQPNRPLTAYTVQIEPLP